MIDGRRRAMVFAGAGASFAVDRSAFPTTVGFYEQLPEEVRNHGLIRHLVAHLEKKFGSGNPDIEKVLWCLDELIDHAQKVEDPKCAVSWMIASNALQEVLRLGSPVNHYAAAAQQAIPKLKALRDQINAALYDCYSTIPSAEQLATNWLPLINGLRARSYWVDFVTTNYDLVIESAIRASHCDIGIGRTDEVIPHLDVEMWRKSSEELAQTYRDGLLTKLHGSLVWERAHGGRIAFGSAMYKSEHKNHVVIYPGFKGAPKDEPFVAFHEYFERSIRNAELLIFIGFAFRDEYINDILARSLTTQRTFSVNVDEIALPAALTNCQQILGGFSEPAIEDVFQLT